MQIPVISHKLIYKFFHFLMTNYKIILKNMRIEKLLLLSLLVMTIFAGNYKINQKKARFEKSNTDIFIYAPCDCAGNSFNYDFQDLPNGWKK